MGRRNGEVGRTRLAREKRERELRFLFEQEKEGGPTAKKSNKDPPAKLDGWMEERPAM